MKQLLILGLLPLAMLYAAAPPYAIINARVVTHGGVAEKTTIILRDGRIETIGPGIALPPDVRVFDAQGLNVYPGLIDAATHYGLPVPATAAPAPPPGPANSPDRYLRPKPWGVSPEISTAVRVVATAQPESRG